MNFCFVRAHNATAKSADVTMIIRLVNITTDKTKSANIGSTDFNGENVVCGLYCGCHCVFIFPRSTYN